MDPSTSNMGLAIAALAFVVRGLTDIVKKYMSRDEDQKLTSVLNSVLELKTESALILSGVKSTRHSLEDSSETITRTLVSIDSRLAELEAESTELLRMHRDPLSPFASVKTNELIENLLREFSSIRSEIRTLRGKGD